MAPRFLGKTLLDGLEPIEVDGHPVLSDHARLRDLLQSRAPVAASLLAEPVGNWGTGDARVVSWYAEASNEPETLAVVSSDRRQQLETQLRNLMAALAPLLMDPAVGPTLRRALVLSSQDGIKAVDGRIVLTDWGLIRAGTKIPADPLVLSPLAAYLPALGGAAPRPHVAPILGAPGSMQPPPPPMPPPSTPVSPPARSVWNWWLVPAGIAVAVAFLIFGLWLGARLVAERVAQQPTAVTLFDDAAVRAALEQQKEQNAALERELEARRRALSGDVCPADPSQMPRTGPDHAAVVPSDATPPPPGGQPFRGSLADLLTQSVVMVIGVVPDGVETGSGFFVAPDLIVTNRHVVEHAEPGKLIVTSSKLGHATQVDIVAESPTSQIGALDVALLRIPADSNVQPLAMSTAATALQPVVAAGFPGLTMRGDEAYGRLLHGDMTAVPTVILTDGTISALQTSESGIKIMPHTASVSGGNSGGPLADACGRVVGINTFIAADHEQVAHTNYAQKSDEIIAFLQANGVHVQVVDAPCVPPTANAPAPTPPAATPTAPTSAPPGAAPPAAPSPG